jgi:N-acetylneuraminate synthase
MIKIIAEIGINHNGYLETAKKLINIAAAAGCDYVKFQKRTPEICVPERMKNKKRQTPWGEISYLEYKKKIEFDYSDYKKIDHFCKNANIKWFASVWDIESAKFMRKFTDIVKIPSALISNEKLCKHCEKNFKFIIMSTGMHTQEEIDDNLINILPNVIMHTNSVYPTPVEELNLQYIKYLQAHYKAYEIGYSSHYYGLADCFAAAAMGVKWIEKHITLNHDMWGTDQKASVEPAGLFKLVKGIRDIEKGQGYMIPRSITEGEQKKRKELKK